MWAFGSRSYAGLHDDDDRAAASWFAGSASRGLAGPRKVGEAFTMLTMSAPRFKRVIVLAGLAPIVISGDTNHSSCWPMHARGIRGARPLRRHTPNSRGKLQWLFTSSLMDCVVTDAQPHAACVRRPPSPGRLVLKFPSDHLFELAFKIRTNL